MQGQGKKTQAGVQFRPLVRYTLRQPGQACKIDQVWCATKVGRLTTMPEPCGQHSILALPSGHKTPQGAPHTKMLPRSLQSVRILQTSEGHAWRAQPKYGKPTHTPLSVKALQGLPHTNQVRCSQHNLRAQGTWQAPYRLHQNANRPYPHPSKKAVAACATLTDAMLHKSSGTTPRSIASTHAKNPAASAAQETHPRACQADTTGTPMSP